MEFHYDGLSYNVTYIIDCIISLLPRRNRIASFCQNNVRQLHMNLLRDESKTIQVEVWLVDGLYGSIGFDGLFFWGGKT